MACCIETTRNLLSDLKARCTYGVIEVDLPTDGLFDFDKATIRRDAASDLSRANELVRSYAGKMVDRQTFMSVRAAHDAATLDLGYDMLDHGQECRAPVTVSLALAALLARCTTTASRHRTQHRHSISE